MVGRKREKEANERKERGKRREVEKHEKGTNFFSEKKIAERERETESATRRDRKRGGEQGKGARRFEGKNVEQNGERRAARVAR